MDSNIFLFTNNGFQIILNVKLLDKILNCI